MKSIKYKKRYIFIIKNIFFTLSCCKKENLLFSYRYGYKKYLNILGYCFIFGDTLKLPKNGI